MIENSTELLDYNDEELMFYTQILYDQEKIMEEILLILHQMHIPIKIILYLPYFMTQKHIKLPYMKILMVI